MFRELLSAPYASSIETIAGDPSRAAIDKGVDLLLSLAMTLAPWASRISTFAAWPRAHAYMSALICVPVSVAFALPPDRSAARSPDEPAHVEVCVPQDVQSASISESRGAVVADAIGVRGGHGWQVIKR